MYTCMYVYTCVCVYTCMYVADLTRRCDSFLRRTCPEAAAVNLDHAVSLGAHDALRLGLIAQSASLLSSRHHDAAHQRYVYICVCVCMCIVRC